ncbi:MAG TPA: penicillin-binding protein 2 [Candidatus Sulfotelmatobacter sp.]|jgi:cell division protein FtsI/penicillin-binding protein 2|nr:penicillin-binding protein 2 [Candidatus Sulfotelmatobacter sp.]
MSNKQQIRRALLLMGILFVAFACLGWRLVDLQILRHDEFARLAEEKTERKTWMVSHRGDILDANGNILATSIPVETIWANPEMLAAQTNLPNAAAVFARILSPMLQEDAARLYSQMLPRLRRTTNGVVTNQYAILKRQISESVWQQIQATLCRVPAGVDTRTWKKSDRFALTNLCLSAIGADPEQMRTNLNGRLAAHVIGFTASNDSTNHTAELAGCDGIEKFFNSKLCGVDGWRVSESDSANREIVAHRDQDVQARDGLNVQLTIDARVQDIVEDELAKAFTNHSPESITGIVLRPKTGEILAMASFPNFDPNQPDTITSNTEPNQCISGVMEPGSTFKTIVISGALDTGRANLNQTVFCENGLFNYAGLHLHDSEGHRFGNLPIWEVLQKSSNIGAVKVAMLLGTNYLHDYISAFGLGAFTGIPLPNEASTFRLVPPLEALTKSKYLIAQVPMGQGIAVTRLQMALVISALANNGTLMRPMLVKCLTDSDGRVVQQYLPQAARNVVRPETARQMVEAMKTVVLDGGTATAAAMKNYTVAGKTGTAEKTEAGRRGYVAGKYIVSFIGFFPADNPQICISVVMDAPKEGGRAFGGMLCGPVFRNIAERCASYLNIPPDANVVTNVPSQFARN